MVITRTTRNRFGGDEPLRGFESHRLRQKFVVLNATVAQLVEQRTRNAQVTGSNPVSSSIFYLKSCAYFAFKALLIYFGIIYVF